MTDPTDDLIDYDELLQQQQQQALQAAAGTGKETALNGLASTAATAAATSAAEAKKGSYVGIHATGFKDFLLKPELLRAITDCGFEHPSEGTLS